MHAQSEIAFGNPLTNLMSTNTPLHIAIQNGNIDIIKSLLADGCETIHARNAEGQTPLCLATATNNEEIVRLLLEHGAGHSPSPPPSDFAYAPLDVEQRKKRITFYTMLVCATLGVPAIVDVIRCLISVAIFSEPHPPHLHMIAGVMYLIYALCFIIPVYMAYLFATVSGSFGYGKRCLGNMPEQRRMWLPVFHSFRFSTGTGCLSLWADYIRA